MDAFPDLLLPDLSDLERKIARKLVAKILLIVFNYLAKKTQCGGPQLTSILVKRSYVFHGGAQTLDTECPQKVNDRVERN